MNKYDEKYIFRLATTEDIENIMNYIKENWKKDHILAVNKDFFYYEHVYDGNVNFMLAISKETNEIEAIQGFIKASLNEECSDIWGVMWSAKAEKNSMPFLGIEILKRLIKETSCRCEIGVGANPKTTVPLVKRLMKRKVDKLNHYYLLNNLENYKIANISDRTKIAENNKQEFKSRIIRLSNINEVIEKYDFSKNKGSIPYKDSMYFDKRYFKHPIYKYIVWGVYTEKHIIDAIVVGREIKIEDRKVLRVVDYIGCKELISTLKEDFQEILTKNEYEYIDFYCYGFEHKTLVKAGFVLRDDNDINIIPNYFEPFVKKNIDIWFDSSEENITICKADADQDRPSTV